MNQPPEILDPAGPRGTEFPFELILENANIARVLAVDPEGGPLDIFWLVPGLPNPDEDLSQEGDTWVGLLFLPRDPELDDLLIRATVVDDAEPPNTENVLFRVEVP